ncbi:MAG: DUF4917 family protein [Solirubrobacterales bacterium]
MPRTAPDGSLRDWSEIADEGWSAILLGNGLSVNLSRYFAYQSLYEEAKPRRGRGGLSDKDRAVFKAFDTTNFEVVLAKLRDAITMAEVLGRKPAPYRQRFRSVQDALGEAVRRVHLEWTEVPDETLGAIKAELRRYGAVFSTSYDLILYWAIGHNDDYGLFRDCFWSNGCEFDPEDSEVRAGGRPVYYMHGALHLIVQGSGVTRKMTQEDGRLLDQFGKPIKGDDEARPLLISEATAREKLRGIEGNDYLAHVYDQFKEQDKPLAAFGHSLSEQDRHLIDAINENPDRPVAISMVRRSKKHLREQQSYIWGKLHTEDVVFYDAATHPLGSAELTINAPRRRFMGRWVQVPDPAAAAAP